MGATFYLSVQIGPEAQPASCAIRSGSFREEVRGGGVKRKGCGANHPHPSSAEVANGLEPDLLLPPVPAQARHFYSYTLRPAVMLQSSTWRQGELLHCVVKTNSCLGDSCLLRYKTMSISIQHGVTNPQDSNPHYNQQSTKTSNLASDSNIISLGAPRLLLQITRSSSSSSSSSSYICHGVGPLVDPFRSHVSRSLFKGLP